MILKSNSMSYSDVWSFRTNIAPFGPKGKVWAENWVFNKKWCSLRVLKIPQEVGLNIGAKTYEP